MYGIKLRVDVGEDDAQFLRTLESSSILTLEKLLRAFYDRFQVNDMLSEALDVGLGIIDGGGVFETERGDLGSQLDNRGGACCCFERVNRVLYEWLDRKTEGIGSW